MAVEDGGAGGERKPAPEWLGYGDTAQIPRREWGFRTMNDLKLLVLFDPFLPDRGGNSNFVEPIVVGALVGALETTRRVPGLTPLVYEADPTIGYWPETNKRLVVVVF